MTITSHNDPEVEASDPRTAYIDGLRRVADFLEQHPDIPIAKGEGERFSFFLGFKFDDKPAAMAAAIRALATQGTVSKDYDVGSSNYVHAGVTIGPHTVGVFTARESVCERVVVGTETVQVPDPDAPPVTVERDVVEWKCHPLLDTRAVTA